MTMTRAVLFALGCCLLGTDPATGQDKPAPLAQDRFLGEWVNADKDTRGLKRLEITRKDDAWQIETWPSLGGGGEGALGKVKLSLLGEGARAKELPYGFATVGESKLGVHHLTLKIEKDELVVEAFRIFSDDGARGRSNYRKVERFKKK
jgi:hypothetical protein